MAVNLPPFDAPYAADDTPLIAPVLAVAGLSAEAEASIDARAARLIAAIRKGGSGLGGVEEFLREYALSTKEGLALMVLAEALLRVPDAETADRLVEDKLAGADFARHERKSEALLVTASAWALGLTARLIQPGETPEGVLGSLVKRIGLPTVRTATRQAVRLMGSHFVLGETIEAALKRAAGDPRYRYSFDMLGEGARTAADAARYFDSYAAAIEAIARSAGNTALPARPGISVKLSALHPRFEAVSHERVLAELAPRVLDLARAAKAHDLNFTVDAEEADRLELMIEVMAKVIADPSLAGWEGFGLAIQAYQKRAHAVIDWFDTVARGLNRRFMIRLVKGAYWDNEIKRTQERGLADYPVFTRKPATDLFYQHCARRLLAARGRIYPQFATHNALTAAMLIEEAGGVEGFEFQRLHGMGEALYGTLLEELPNLACRVYAPVGGHRDLLAYLVRRLLENGANSSFVSVAADPDVPVSDLLVRPAAKIGTAARARSRVIPLPANLFGENRLNSRGVEFGDRVALAALREEIAAAGAPSALPAPTDAAVALDAAVAAFPAWDRTAVAVRAGALERVADLMEARRGALIALLQSEGGKTIDDALAEVREAVDFCRYYAHEARKLFGAGTLLPGPTGEENRLTLRGRGAFVCISPWNFPLAIFVGQVVAALAAGNSVIAKPASQTPRIAALAVSLLHEAGVPPAALHLFLGNGAAAARLVADPRVAGVAFTGSTQVGRSLARTLAEKDGPIVPLIAETGGINAMIVDATALPEQVADDVVTSAFRSAGQRCSALRLLCVQTDVADHILTMVQGAAAELRVDDPRRIESHVGPVIDAAAKAQLDAYVERQRAAGRLVWQGTPSPGAPVDLPFVAPAIVRLDRPEDLTEEVFGPVLHVVTWQPDRLDALLDSIAANGTGLTLGLHTRIDETIARVVARLSHGNVYVNRNMIGAVVGVQPFGGAGTSGTGPKAGGPHYLPRFALEQTISVNTAAAGGNATLLATLDD